MIFKHVRELALRAATGAQFLDQVAPNWPARIDTRTLDIANPLRCALGQLYGDYGHGLVHSGFVKNFPLFSEGRTEACLSHGFNLPKGKVNAYIAFPILNYFWRREVRSRLALAS